MTLHRLPDWAFRRPGSGDAAAWRMGIERQLGVLDAVLRQRVFEQVEASGLHEATGSDVQTDYSWDHGMGSAPDAVSVVAANAASRGFHVSVDATQVTVTLGSAPSNGAPLAWYWMAV